MAERLKKIMIVFCILIVWPFHIGGAEETGGENSLWRELNKTSDTVLNYVKEGHYDEAKQILDKFSNQFLAIRASDYHLSMSELRVITTTFDEAMEATVAVSMSHEDRVAHVSKLRLLVDVYDTSHQPLWHETKNSLVQPLLLMQEAVTEGDVEAYERALHRFLKNFDTVSPAWSVGLPIETYQQISAQLEYLKSIKEINGSNISDHLNLIEDQLHSIYDGSEDSSSDPSLIWVMLTIGGAILFSLSYTGWQKYRAEREKEKKLKRKRRKI
ncbi:MULTISPECIES: sporulation protein YpjB [Bacillaceae]|uniref:Sporulation protein YpjB n=1 Tax=Evansella alkalicola TaxID=745819 RepID=A0ABS6JZB3_9BACI|nr:MULTISPECIES: sporulation protein YpjB [Bacillaceae]MBU9723928.1 sporulation protein YpjB [Bacillus alkalicola]